MNEKIQAVAQTIKSVILYILTPLFVILGIIYLLWHRSDELESQLKEAHYDDTKQDTLKEQANIDANADDAVNKFERLYAEYKLQQRTSGVLGRNSGTEKANPDSGPKNPAG